MKGWTQEAVDKFKDRKPFINPGPVTINKIINSPVLLKKVRAKMKYEESDLQINCVKMFRLMYPKLKWRLFSIPSGGYRNAITASILKAEGLLPGVSDLVLMIPKNRFGAMFIEIKTTTGRLSDYQVQFIKEMQKDYYCVVCRTVEHFLSEIENYLHGTSKKKNDY